MNGLLLVNQTMVHIGIGEAGLIGIVGYLVVFFGLILLMLVVMLVGKIMTASQKKKAPAAVAPAPAPKSAGKPAPGTAGELKLHDVSEKDAAMLMAIVAHKLNKPLNELRFKSIREVK